MKTSVVVVFLLSSVVALHEVGKHKKYARVDTGSITNGNNKFAVSLFKSVADSSEANTVMSPISIHLALALMYLGAKGNTAQQMAETLHIPKDHISVRLGFRQMLNSLKSSEDMDLEIANMLCIDSSFNVLKNFRRAARKAFGSGAREMNFQKNTEKVTKIINSWVEKRTLQKITHIIEAGHLTPDTKMVLINAVYLKADWRTKFNSDDTKEEIFYTNTGEQINVPMMTLKTDFGYKNSEELGAKILELPYKGEAVSMFILLPDQQNGITDLELKLPTVDFTTLFNNLTQEEFVVKLPRFKAESTISLKSHLQELGLKDMFDVETADFSGITGQRDVVASHALHKAFIDVTELGTEAGASTAIVIESRMWKPPPVQFVADHPFVFVIWHKKLNTNLFMGRLMKPE